MEINKLISSFKKHLLDSELEKNSAKIIVFGSYAKGSATAESDIDILVFKTNGIAVEKAIMDRTYDFMLENNAPLEVLIAGIDELFLNQSYFTYNITCYGLEIYSMEKDEIKAAMTRDLKNLAEEYFESAQEVLALKRIRLAVDAAYNAAELAVKALILFKQDDLPGSHGGIVSLFGQLYVKTGELDKVIGRSLNASLRVRNVARYKPDALLSKEDAEDVLKLAERLLQIASDKITRDK